MGVAVKSPDMAGLVEELESIVGDILDKNPQLAETLRSGFVSHDQKTQLLDRIFNGRASTTVLHFLKVLSAHHRIALFRTIVRTVRKLYSKHLGLTDVEVRVAREMNANLRTEVQNQIASSLGCKPQLHVVVDPSLIAGMVIKVGDRVYDSSVRTQFDLARKSMIERASHLIEASPQQFLSTQA